MMTHSTVAAALLALTGAGALAQRPVYPQTKKVDQVDDFFGKNVADPTSIGRREKLSFLVEL